MKDKSRTKASAAAAAAARRKDNVVELSVDNEARVRNVLKVCGMLRLTPKSQADCRDEVPLRPERGHCNSESFV